MIGGGVGEAEISCWPLREAYLAAVKERMSGRTCPSWRPGSERCRAIGAALLAIEARRRGSSGSACRCSRPTLGRPLTAAARAAAAGYDGCSRPITCSPRAQGGPRSSPSRPRRPSPRSIRISRRDPRDEGLARPAGLLAKQAAALDQMSGGRPSGLGAGDSVSKPEHEAFGIPFASASDRVAILERPGALRALFGARPGREARMFRRSPGRSSRPESRNSGSEADPHR